MFFRLLKNIYNCLRRALAFRCRAAFLNGSIIVVFSLFVFSYSLPYVFADEDEETNEEIQEDLDDLQDKIEEYEEKLEKLQKREATLQNEIEYANSQISLTELRIQSAIAEISKKEAEIVRLEEDIDRLKDRIGKLKSSIAYQQEILGERKRAHYKLEESTPPDIELILFLINPSELDKKIQKDTYSKVMQDRDKKLLDEMEETKDAFNNQKNLFEDKKEEEEELKAQLQAQKASLEGYRVDLENQKASKNKLLKDTQNDEAKYQRLLEDARKELQQIIGAASALKDFEPKRVGRGDVIGVQGNTGYSFGDHLHFGVYKYDSLDEIVDWDWYYSNYVDPAKKLKNKTVHWDTGCSSEENKSVGSGDWRWPMDSPTISQGYGNTCYSNLYYGGKPHPAYDMYGVFGAPIYAVEDGDAYFCRNCLGDGGNGVFIFHDDDYMTLYWHLK